MRCRPSMDGVNRRSAPQPLPVPFLSARFLSGLGYAGFVAVTAWTIAFLAGVAVPRVVDGPARTTTPLAVAADLSLLGFFAAQHSVMARRPVKAWLRRRIPASLER